jgi:hypothetical protein
MSGAALHSSCSRIEFLMFLYVVTTNPKKKDWVWHLLVKVAPLLNDTIKHGGLENAVFNV